MNRRLFLQALGAGVSLVAVSQELADLLSPKKTIFLPPATGWPGSDTVLFKGLPLTRGGADELVRLIERRMNEAAAAYRDCVVKDLYSPGRLEFRLEERNGIYTPQVMPGNIPERCASAWTDRDGLFDLVPIRVPI
jgi:hypothetical protein